MKTVVNYVRLACVFMSPVALILLLAAAPEPETMIGLTYIPAGEPPPLWFSLPLFAILFVGGVTIAEGFFNDREGR